MGYSTKNTVIKNAPSLIFTREIEIKHETSKVARIKGRTYHSNYHKKENEIKLALIDSRPLTRISFTHLLETDMPEKRRSEDFTVLPFSSTDDLSAHFSEDHDHAHMIIFNIGATCVSEDKKVYQNIQRLKQEFSDTPLIILSGRDERSCVLEAFRCGVHSYISTTLSPPVVIQVLRLILVGGKFIPPHSFLDNTEEAEVTGLMLETHNQMQSAKAKALQELTPRQKEVLQLLRIGKSNKIIAHELNMQESTVKVHVSQIMKKLKAINRTHAVFLASQIMEN